MAQVKLYNLARMSVSGTPGTGTITLLAAVGSFLTFAGAGISDGEIVRYAIEDGQQREIGQGTYTAAGTTLSRDTVNNSTNGGAKITATSAAQVFITPAQQDFTWRVNGSNTETSSVVSALNTTASASMVTGCATFGGGIGVSGAAHVNQLALHIAPTTGPAIDGTGVPSTVCNTGANVAISPASVGAGNFWIMVVEYASIPGGPAAMYIAVNGTVKLVSLNASPFVASTTTPAAGEISVAYDGGTTTYRLYNNQGTNGTFYTLLWRYA